MWTGISSTSQCACERYDKKETPLVWLREKEYWIENNNIQRHHSYKTFCVLKFIIFIFRKGISFFLSSFFVYFGILKIDKETPHKKKGHQQHNFQTFLHFMEHNFHISQRNFVMCLCGVQFIDKKKKNFHFLIRLVFYFFFLLLRYWFCELGER